MRFHARANSFWPSGLQPHLRSIATIHEERGVEAWNSIQLTWTDDNFKKCDCYFLFSCLFGSSLLLLVARFVGLWRVAFVLLT